MASTPPRWADGIVPSYDAIAEQYAAHYFDELDGKPFDRDVLARFAAAVKDRGRVCDLGCGPGQIARYLAARGVDAFGIDASASMVATARGSAVSGESEATHWASKNLSCHQAGPRPGFSSLHLPHFCRGRILRRILCHCSELTGQDGGSLTMEPVTILSIFSAVVAAVWTAWTWKEQHNAVRQVQRDQAAALYVNPLLLAGHQLQRRLGGLLDGRELAFNQPTQDGGQDGSVSAAAIETLWTLAQFFGWTAVNMRHGPYTRDPKVVELIVAISRTFDDRERFGNGAFHFSTAEQESLAQTVLHRIGQTTVQAGESSAALTEFAAVTAVDFERDFRDPQSSRAGLYGGRAVRNAVEEIDRAERVEPLEGRERLTAVQQLLRRLLVHLERLEGFSVSLHEVREVPPEGIAAAALANVAPPRILHRVRGRIRLGIPALRTNKDFADRLEALIRAWQEVEDVSINVTAGSVAIRYRTTVPDNEFQAKILASIGKAMHTKDGEAPADVPRRRPQGAASGRPAATEEGAHPVRRQRARLR